MSLHFDDIEELSFKERVGIFNLISDLSSKLVGLSHPALNVRLVEAESIQDNDYNPNSVALPEYRLLKHSIRSDGLTMPVVVGKSPHNSGYVVIDGAHRTRIIKTESDINQSLANYIPVVVLDKGNEERMSSSIRHNMARGEHQVELTANLVMRLRQSEWTDEKIGQELGMDKDEVLRMQQITGLAEAFKDQNFSEAWE
ncbi:chromosome partitioning protein ParB (plasmid) [Vibrio azureus]|nr:chromosome partitioning protein ParB [Vibrio azureus]